MLLRMLVFEQKGEVSSIFAIIPAIAYNRKNRKERDKKAILELLRYDKECSIAGPNVPDKNPSLDISTIEFYCSPLMEMQLRYKTLPHQLVPTIQVIDVFTCLGSRFGLDSLSVIVEVCESTYGKRSIWANIYYAADSEIPATIITVNNYNIFFKDDHLPYKKS